MIYIRKNTEPSKLRNYRRMQNACFDDMDADVKNELRESLLKEQGYICAYCMSRIHDSGDVKIEHFRARDEENELDYQNLLAVCKGNEGQPRRLQTCDTRKGNLPLCISPLNQNDMRTIYYKNNGEIHSSVAEMDADIDEVLNLNCPNGYLVSNRKAALQSIRNLLKKNLKPGQDAKSYFLKLQQIYETQEGSFESYVGIIRWYINKKLREQSA